MSTGPFFRCVVDSLDFFIHRNDTTRVISMLRMMAGAYSDSPWIIIDDGFK